MERVGRCIATNGEYVEWPKRNVLGKPFLLSRFQDSHPSAEHPVCAIVKVITVAFDNKPRIVRTLTWCAILCTNRFDLVSLCVTCWGHVVLLNSRDCSLSTWSFTHAPASGLSTDRKVKKHSARGRKDVWLPLISRESQGCLGVEISWISARSRHFWVLIETVRLGFEGVGGHWDRKGETLRKWLSEIYLFGWKSPDRKSAIKIQRGMIS
jgi:hypothetical protein